MVGALTNEPRNVVAQRLVRRGIEVCARGRNRAWRRAVFDPVDQRRQEVEAVGRRSAGAVVHIWHRIEPREVLGLVQSAELLRHLRIIIDRAGNGRTGIGLAHDTR